MLLWCWDKDPEKRPNFASLIENIKKLQPDSKRMYPDTFEMAGEKFSKSSKLMQNPSLRNRPLSTMQKTEPADKSLYFFPDISNRQQAEEKMVQHNATTKRFLIRNSDRNPGQMALTIKLAKDQFTHISIEPLPDNRGVKMLGPDGDIQFATLEMLAGYLVQFYGYIPLLQ